MTASSPCCATRRANWYAGADHKRCAIHIPTTRSTRRSRKGDRNSSAPPFASPRRTPDKSHGNPVPHSSPPSDPYLAPRQVAAVGQIGPRGRGVKVPPPSNQLPSITQGIRGIAAAEGNDCGGVYDRPLIAIRGHPGCQFASGRPVRPTARNVFLLVLSRTGASRRSSHKPGGLCKAPRLSFSPHPPIWIPSIRPSRSKIRGRLSCPRFAA